MTDSIGSIPGIPSQSSIMIKLLTIVFAAEATIALLEPAFVPHGSLLVKSLIDATLLVLCAMPMLRRAMSSKQLEQLAGGNSALLSTAARRLVVVLLVLFTIEFVVMIALNLTFPGISHVVISFADALLVTIICACVIWRLFPKVFAPNEVLPPLMFFTKLLLVILAVEIVEDLLIPVNNLNKNISREFTDSMLLLIAVAPVLWFFVIQPLRKAAIQGQALSKTLCDQVVDGIIMINDQGVIELFNPAAEKMFGYKALAMTGENISRLLSGYGSEVPDLGATNGDGAGNNLLTKGSFETRGIRSSGEIFPVEISVSPVMAEESRCSMVIIRDITDRVRAEEALRESEECFRSTFSQAAVGIAHVDSAGRFLKINQRFCEIVGYSQEEMLDRTFHSITHPDDLTTDIEQFHKLAQGVIDTFSLEKRYYHKDGRIVWINLTASAVRAADGSIHYFIGVIEDISTRKQVEQSLKESESKFRMLSEASPVGVFLTDPDGNYLYTNNRWQEIAGLSPPESLGNGWMQVVHGEDREELLTKWQRCIDDGLDFISEFRFQTPLEEVRWVRSRVAVLRNEPGNILGYVGTVENITEQKLAEQQHEMYLSLIDATLESTGDGLLVVDRKGRIQNFNRKFLEMFKVPLDFIEHWESVALMGYVKQFMSDPEWFESRAQEIFQCVEAESIDQIHLKDGRVFECNSQPQRVEDVCVGRVWSFRDITDRMRAQQALMESEARFRQIFEQSEDAIILFDREEGRIVDVNPVAEKLHGFTRNEFLERGLACFSAYTDFESLMQNIAMLEPDASFRIDAMRSRKADGSECCVSARGKFVSLGDRLVVYCTFRDITERVRLEEESRTIQSRLIQTNKMESLGVLVSGIAHEINNPNNFIMTNSELLSRVWADIIPVLEESYREHGEFLAGGLPCSELRDHLGDMLEGICVGSRRIRDIINNLKDFSRDGRLSFKGEVDVNRTVLMAASIIGHQINRYTRNFELNLDETLPPVPGSAQQIEQVLINLLINSLQALPDKKCKVWVSTCYDRESGFIQVNVGDEGEGIPADVANRIMEPFFTTKLDSGGTGLGLSISQSIIKEHGGSLTFVSTPGAGTVFTLSLPVRNERFESTEHNEMSQEG